MRARLPLIAVLASAALAPLCVMWSADVRGAPKKKRPQPAASAVPAANTAAAPTASASAQATATSAAAASAPAATSATLEEPPAEASSASAGFNSGPDPLGAGVSAALLVGYAFNDVRLGLGARIGYTLPMKLYVGATFLYHFGSTPTETVNGVTFPVSVNLFYLGPEAGYDLVVGPVVVRPTLGLGVAHANATATNGAATSDQSSTNFAVWPGVVGLYPITAHIAAGLDARAFLVSGYSTFILSLTGAYRF